MRGAERMVQQPLRRGVLILLMLSLLVGLAACSKPPKARVDGQATTQPPREDPVSPLAQDPLPPPPGDLDSVPSAPPDWEPGGDLIRIGLRAGAPELGLEAKGVVRFESLDGKSRGRSAAPGALRLRALSGGIQVSAPGLGPSVLEARALILRSDSDEIAFEFKGNEYAGDLLVRRESNGTLTLITLIDLETYLRGVVPWEIGRPGLESLEAVKAQAIAARTYTVAHLDRRAAVGLRPLGQCRGSGLPRHDRHPPSHRSCGA